MHPNASLEEIAKPILSIAPQSITSGQTVTGSTIFTGYSHQVSAFIAAGAGSGSAAVTLLQYAGTSSKALAFPPYYFLDTATTSAGIYTKTANSGDTVTLTANQRAVIDVRPESLDIANGYDHVALKVVMSTGPLVMSGAFHMFQRYEGAANEPSSV